MIRYRTNHIYRGSSAESAADCGTCSGGACGTCEFVQIPENREDSLELEVFELRREVESMEETHTSEVELLEKQIDRYHDLKEKVDEVVDSAAWVGEYTAGPAKGMYQDIVGTLLK